MAGVKARGAWEIRQSSTAPAGTIGLLETVEFGTDGLRYRRLGVAAQLLRFHSPQFFSAHENGELLGVYILDGRDVQLNGIRTRGYYRAALAVHHSWQGQGVGLALTDTAVHWMDHQQDGAGFSFGCIDASNQRSLNLLASQGAVSIGSLCMYMMYRQWHRQPLQLSSQTHQLWADDALVRRVYGNYRIRDITQASTEGTQGFSLMDKEGIVISARVAPSAFCISSMGRMATTLTRLTVTPWPAARARFNPRNFQYVSFSHVLIRPGCEAHWRDFVSSVLAHYRCHFGALYIDPASALYTSLRQVQGWSRWLHRPSASIRVVVRRGLADQQNATDIGQTDGPVILWPVDA